MKKIIFSIIFIILAVNTWAATSTGFGTSSLDGGIKVADKRALNNALINAIASYYASTNPEKADAISIEHLKLIKKFRILERGVQQSSVFYKVEVEFDEIGQVNLATKINPNTIVYYIKLESNLKEYRDLFNNLARKMLEENNFSLKYQEDFIINVDKSGDSEKAYSLFSVTRSRYLLHTSLKIEKSKAANKLISETYFYTKKDTYPIIRAEATINKMNNEGLQEAFNKVYLTTVSYIMSNFINTHLTTEPPKENKYDLIFVNFKSFNQVMNVMDYLRSKGFFVTVKVKSVVTGKAELELVTKSDIASIKKVVEEQLKDVDHTTDLEANSLLVEFK